MACMRAGLLLVVDVEGAERAGFQSEYGICEVSVYSGGLASDRGPGRGEREGRVSFSPAFHALPFSTS